MRYAAVDAPQVREQIQVNGARLAALLQARVQAREVPVAELRAIPFFKDQRLLALRNRGMIDPDSIEEYIARDGYKALANALARKQVEQRIRMNGRLKKLRSGLQGWKAIRAPKEILTINYETEIILPVLRITFDG